MAIEQHSAMKAQAQTEAQPASGQEAQLLAAGPIVLFDGVCNLCQSTVQFIIRRDPAQRFRFASLQSPIAQRLLAALERPDDSLSSVLLLAEGQVYRKSAAALAIARRLQMPWPALYYLAAWVPRPLADRVYDFIGRRRYRWFGRKAECWIPDTALRRRFLDQTA